MTARHLVATVLFVDVVSSTERALELGNRRWHELLRRYHEVARRAARRFGGRDAGTAGDGLLFTFGQPGEALHAALAIRAAVAELGLQIRAGVHMGEIEGSGRELGGFALHAGARVTERAHPGEVLVSGTVRDALVGSGFEFADRGSHTLKGMPGEWRLHAVTGAPATAGPGSAGGRRRVRPRTVAVAVAAVVLLAGAWWIAGHRPGPADTTQATSLADGPVEEGRGVGGGLAAASAVAILPFAVRGSEEVGYLGEGMVDLLSTKLDGAGQLRSVDPRAVLSLARETGYEGDPARAARLAAQLGADLYVLGSVLEAGGRLQLDVRLYDRGRGREAIARGTVEGEADRLFELVDDCVGQLLAGVAGGPEARVTRLAAVTTHSLPALKAYLQGERALRGGDFQEALDAFQSATTTDSLFALAWYKLSIASEWSAGPEEQQQATAERALRHSSRLSEHDRQLLEAFAVYRRAEAEDAERRYRAILATYPEDLEAWHQLGEVLFHYAPLEAGSIAESRPAWERVLAIDPENVLALTHLARVAAVEGRTDETASLVARIEALSPEGDRVAEMLALRAHVGGDAPARAAAVEALRRANDTAAAFAVWNVAVYAQDLRGALELANAMTEPVRSTEARALGHTLAAYLEVAHGRVRAANARLDAAAALEPVLALEHRSLLSALPFVPGADDGLEQLRQQLEELDPTAVPRHVTQGQFFISHDPAHAVLRHYLLGLLAYLLGRVDEAERLAAELADLPTAQHQPRLLAENLAAGLAAEVLTSRGQPERAVAVLTELAPVPYGIQLASPFYLQSRERYRLAELLTELGRDADALPRYGSYRQHSMYEVPYWAPADLALGRAYERLGEPRQATHHYARVVELWSECDAELRPLLEEARGALRRLESAAVAPASGASGR